MTPRLLVYILGNQANLFHPFLSHTFPKKAQSPDLQYMIITIKKTSKARFNYLIYLQTARVPPPLHCELARPGQPLLSPPRSVSTLYSTYPSGCSYLEATSAPAQKPCLAARPDLPSNSQVKSAAPTTGADTGDSTAQDSPFWNPRWSPR
jgi:hypothetical protein